ICAICRKRYKETGSGHASDTALKLVTKMGCQIMRDQSIHRFSLGEHSAALGGGNERGSFGKLCLFAAGQSAFAQFQCLDQSPMDCEVGIAPNGRGEMCIMLQVQPEMPDII